ncbi:MAG TPA: peptidylprolyl isomerase [Polyangiaceae bacterium]|jgi:cyclophilin family peptidyl-prolyl cis-trans isomerase/HEAT repeat protein
MRSAVFALSLALGSCRAHSASPTPAPGSSALVSAPATTEILKSIARVEQARDSSLLDATVLANHDASVRRRAARALARNADEKAVEFLQQTLSDEDPEVITWSAYGLGYACRGHEQPLVRKLTARAASLVSLADAQASSLWTPEEAIADALGRCGGSEAEGTLRDWLRGPRKRAEAAALALGRVAGAAGQLDDATIVTLLDVAAPADRALENALYPFTRLASLSPSTGARLLKQAQAVLEHDTPASEFATRALGRVAAGGADALLDVVTQPGHSSATRASAARELVKLGAPAREFVERGVAALLNAPPSDESLLEPTYGIVSELLSGLSAPPHEAVASVTLLANLPVSGSESAAILRRKVHLRCAAAALLAGNATTSARLLACDPQKSGREGLLAVLCVLNRAPIVAARARTFSAFLQNGDNLVREAALGLIPAHPELESTYRSLAEALGSAAPGVVASAARVLSSYPNRAAAAPAERSDEKIAPHPDPSVIQALSGAFQRFDASPNLELKSALIDAAGALEVLGLKEKIELACKGESPSLREHAEQALRLLGDNSRKCAAESRALAAIGADAAVAAGRYPIVLRTDVGDLEFTLDAEFAPKAVARVLELVRSKFYDGLVVHRVVPGFVAQFGDPGGDGYGGADRPALRCETAPVSFERASVGIALAGRDTGDSQLFVTLGRHPYLDGDYTLVGEASPGFERLAEGDVIVAAGLKQ